MPIDPIIAAGELPADAVVLDCRVSADAYRAGHLAGAYHAQLERDLASPVSDAANGGRHPLPALAAFAATLGRWGITPTTHVVAYDDQHGANAASRLWWLLRSVGHTRVQIVDGGLPALVAAGHALTTDEPAFQHTEPYPVTGWELPTATIDDVEAARGADDLRVIDVRSGVRFRGETETIDPIAGHIPGARNAPFADNLRADGTFKSAAELRTLLLAALDGIDPAHTIIHCGSGVTACHTLAALERAGLPGARLYVGSWSEWCRNPQRPRAP